jgi:hypothetical protein
MPHVTFNSAVKRFIVAGLDLFESLETETGLEMFCLLNRNTFFPFPVHGPIF